MSEETAAPLIEPTANPAPGQQKPSRNILGLIALGLMALGTIFAFIPATNVISWIFLLAAFIIAIIGLTRKGQGKVTSIIALVLSFVFWIVAIFLGISFAVAGVTVPNTVVPAPGSSSDSGGAEAAAGIGDTVTSPKGVAVTANGVDYEATWPTSYALDDVKGSLAAVNMTIMNGDKEKISLSSSSVIAYIGDVKYEASALFGPEASWFVYEDVNPGLGTDFDAYFDLPPDAKITKIVFETDIIFGEKITFDIK